MDTKKVVVLPWIHKVLINQGARRHNARNPSRVLRLTLCFGWCIIDILVAYCNMLVEVLDKNFEITIQLVGGEASLGPLALISFYQENGLLTDHRYWRLLTAFQGLSSGFSDV